jgi:ribosomal RNA large subunit methyltransferase H
MKLLLLVVGRTVDKHLSTLIDDYTGRIKHYMPFELEVIPELKNAKSLSFEQQKEREGELLLRSMKDGDAVWLLDEGGREFRSIEFAAFLDRQHSSGARRLVFVVGGPYGFSPAIYARANGKISLSRLTFSHQMVRLFFTEQLYRAMTILRGEPYHHE